MIDVVKTSFDVSLDEPFRAMPGEEHIAEGGVTSSFWAEAVGIGGELRLVVGVHQGAHHFLQQFIRPTGDT
jgi:hypothetical protein